MKNRPPWLIDLLIVLTVLTGLLALAHVLHGATPSLLPLLPPPPAPKTTSAFIAISVQGTNGIDSYFGEAIATTITNGTYPIISWSVPPGTTNSTIWIATNLDAALNREYRWSIDVGVATNQIIAVPPFLSLVTYRSIWAQTTSNLLGVWSELPNPVRTYTNTLPGFTNSTVGTLINTNAPPPPTAAEFTRLRTSTSATYP